MKLFFKKRIGSRTLARTVSRKAVAVAMVSFIAFAGISNAFVFAPTAEAAINQEINYQGKLTTPAGVAVTNGNYNIEFKLYTALTGGTAIWTEDDYNSAGAGVPISGGLFSLMLGSTTPLTGVNFNQTLYLGVNIGGTSVGSVTLDGEMTPRKILGAVPAALVANTLQGFSPSEFIRSDAANSTSTASAYLSITNTGSGDIADFVGASATKGLFIQSGGNVGIGTTSPYSMLSVAGQVVAQNFVGTSTTVASNFYEASTTLLTAATNAWLPNAGTYIGTLTGPLQALNGLVSASSSLSVAYGGTGVTTIPTYGKILVGNSSGGYTLTSTSSLGISGGGGTNFLTNSSSNTYLNTGSILQASFIQATSSVLYPDGTLLDDNTDSLYASGTLQVAGASTLDNGFVTTDGFGDLNLSGDMVNGTGNLSSNFINVNGQVSPGASGNSDQIAAANGYNNASGNGFAGGEMLLSGGNGGTGTRTGANTVGGNGGAFFMSAGSGNISILNSGNNTSRGGVGADFNFSPGSGGDAQKTVSGTGAVTGGATGKFTVNAGTAGSAFGDGSGAATGGAGGANSFSGSNGGSASGSTGTNTGGAGGSFSFTAGGGGNATGGTTATGGIGGGISFTTFIGGNGSGANSNLHGQDGDMKFTVGNYSSSTVAHGNIIFGSVSQGGGLTGTAMTITGINDFVGVGTTAPSSTFTVTGAVCISKGAGATTACGSTAGTAYADAFNSSGTYDVAEEYVASDLSIAPGTVVALDPRQPLHIIKATQGSVILGIISTNPGLLLGGADVATVDGSSTRPVALAGRVPIQVSMENGPIAIGDPLTISSSTAGVAMKATDSNQPIIATALEATTTPGQIMVFVRSSLTSGIALGTSTPTIELARPFDSLTTEFQNLLAGTEQWLNAKLVAVNGFFNNLFTEHLTVGSSSKPSGITLYDQVTGQPYCLSIANGQTAAVAGACNASVQNQPTSNVNTISVSTSTSPNNGNNSGSDNASTTPGDDNGGVTISDPTLNSTTTPPIISTSTPITTEGTSTPSTDNSGAGSNPGQSSGSGGDVALNVPPAATSSEASAPTAPTSSTNSSDSGSVAPDSSDPSNAPATGSNTSSDVSSSGGTSSPSGQ